MLKHHIIVFGLVLLSNLFYAIKGYAAMQAIEYNQIQLLEVKKIWDKAPHNAFTDLIRYRNRWWCAFREGQNHVSPDGAIRIIASSDGNIWKSVALLRSRTEDLRDPHLTITPDNRLMLNAAGAIKQGNVFIRQSYVWFSKSGRTWGEAIPVADPNFWIWRVTWHTKCCYGIGYNTFSKTVRLYRSQDGSRFEPMINDFNIPGFPNESSIIFSCGTAYCLLRREQDNALFGTAVFPYSDWQWKDTGVRLGGPNMLQLPNCQIIAAVRLYDRHTRTALCWIDTETGKLREAVTLPSGGDTSYAGLVWYNGLLWVSYYSSHEGKPSIYLAKVKIAMR
ncbi:MAG: exo-alpha-sialidase [bacterium]|nr:exo-alpha-sialidase [bacterium]